jgi:8-oxo-dGTP pyrophosphatase MutT (NUDIX family)
MSFSLVTDAPDLRVDVPGPGRFVLRVAAVITRGDAVLMMSNTVDDYLYTVGGAVRLGESSRAAVAREVEEETGIRVDTARLAAVGESFYTDRQTPYHEICLYYWVPVPTDAHPMSASTTASGDTETLVWVPLPDYGRHRAAFPAFLPDLINAHQIRHYIDHTEGFTIADT